MKDVEGAIYWFVAAAAGWIAANLIGKPLLAMRETIANISKPMVQYATDDTAVPIRLTPPGISRLVAEDPTEEGRKTYLQLAGTLISNLNAIPFYSFWSLVRLLPPQDNVQDAYRNLIGL